MLTIHVDSSFQSKLAECGAAAIVMDAANNILSIALTCKPCEKPSDAELEAIRLGVNHAESAWKGCPYEVRSDCKTVVEKVQKLEPGIPVKWVPRLNNSIADAYAYEALEYGLTKEVIIKRRKKDENQNQIFVQARVPADTMPPENANPEKAWIGNGRGKRNCSL